MNDLNARDLKLVQYLNEAYGKEKELEQALEAHIGLTTRPNYRKRLEQHLRETKSHGNRVERRIKQLGGVAETVSLPGPDAVSEAAEAGIGVAQRALALAKGPLHAIRGTGEQEKMLKNAKTEFSEEAEEIATYTAIETLAKQVGDKETAQLAKEIRREEQRMASFLEKLIPQLVNAVAKAEIPSVFRTNGGTSRRRTSSRRTSASRSSASGSRSSRSSSGSTRTSARAGSSSRSGASSRRKTTARSGSRSGSSRSGSSSRRSTKSS